MFYRFVTCDRRGFPRPDLHLPCSGDCQAMLIAIGLSRVEGAVEIWSARFVARVPAMPSCPPRGMFDERVRVLPLEVA